MVSTGSRNIQKTIQMESHTNATFAFLTVIENCNKRRIAVRKEE